LSTGSPQILEFQCPKCAKRLKAGVAFAGRRVKCPQCSEPVRVPEIAVEKITAVDAWLNLDAPVLEKSPVDIPPKKPTFSPSSSMGQSTAAREESSLSPAGTGHATPEPRRSMFDDDLPDLAELESGSSKRHDVADIFQLEGLDELVASIPPATRGTKPAAAASPKPSETDYRVICRTCGTPLFVKLDRVGKMVACPDCHSSFAVPAPPAGWSSTKKKVELHDDGVDVPLAPPEAAQSANTLDSQRASASEYLANAKQQIDDDELDSLYQGEFDTAGFLTRTFGFLTDPSAVAQMVLYGFMFSGVFALAQFSNMKIGAGGFEGGGYLLVLFILVTVVTILISLPMLSASLALLESVANRQRRVAEWPSFNVFDNFGEVLVVVFSLTGSLLPGMLVGGLIGRSGGAEWLIMTGMMGTCFLLFPILLLSMLDNGSPLQPISGAVVKSIPQLPEAWGGYYLKNLVAYGSMTVLWYILLGRNPLMSAIAGFFVPCLLFFTCQQIGALADSISEHLSFEFVPPDHTAGKEQSEAKSD
jgi:DNA-directed RNA polymerase subunit RPC12/RpoP